MTPNPRHARLPRRAAVALAALAVCSAHALELDTGVPDFKLRWDHTVKYSAGFRVKERSPGLATTAFGPTGVVGPNNINQNDGDNNFNRGLISNRLDLLSELDASYRGFGARLSAAAWYDRVYNRSTDSTDAFPNAVPGTAFTAETRKIMGRKAELLDAFAYANFSLNDRPASLRLGRHTLLWGESLFFGANGIAGGMAPLDLPKLLSVPNAQFKEIARPTGKLSGQMQIASGVTLGGYVAYEWDKTRLIPVGAYLSTSDSLGPGAERIVAGPLGTFRNTGDVDARNSGQFGVQLRWNVESIDTDFGVYAIRFHANGPSNINTAFNGPPPPANGSARTFRWLYHEGVKAVGVSFAKTIDAWSLAGEASYRTNSPLASSGVASFPSIGLNAGLDNRDNPAYAVGESAHLQFSWLASLGPGLISREASFLGEIAWNQRTKVTRNPQMLNPNADKSAVAIRTVYSPAYRQVVPGLDLTPSVGLGYTWGKSSALGPSFGPDKGGDLNVGLGAVYLGNWYANLSYVHYLGSEGPTLDNASNAQFKQALKDRNFVTVSLRTTF